MRSNRHCAEWRNEPWICLRNGTAEEAVVEDPMGCEGLDCPRSSKEAWHRDRGSLVGARQTTLGFVAQASCSWHSKWREEGSWPSVYHIPDTDGCFASQWHSESRLTHFIGEEPVQGTKEYTCYYIISTELLPKGEAEFKSRSGSRPHLSLINSPCCFCSIHKKLLGGSRELSHWEWGTWVDLGPSDRCWFCMTVS